MREVTYCQRQYYFHQFVVTRSTHEQVMAIIESNAGIISVVPYNTIIFNKPPLIHESK